MYLKLAWRNIWRNKKRTLISIFAVFLAVSLSIFVRSQYLGSYEIMMQNTVGSFLGYIKIEIKKNPKNPNVNKTFQYNPKSKKNIESLKSVKNAVPRLSLTSFVGNPKQKKVAFILGIDPKLEQYISNPQQRLIQGKYFSQNAEKAVILAENLAKKLKLKVGDSLAIFPKDSVEIPVPKYFLVKGIAKIPQPDLNQKLLYLPLQTCQDLFKMQNHISAYILDIDNLEQIKAIQQKVQHKIDKDKLSTITWEESNPELKQILLVQNIATNIVVFVLYMIVGFGIFGTILMMLTERQKECKTLISIGLKRQKLALMLFTEIMVLTALGVMMSNIFMYSLLFYLHNNPIQLSGEMAQLMQEVGMPAKIYYSMDTHIFLKQSIIIFSLTSFLALYVFRYVMPLSLIS